MLLSLILYGSRARGDHRLSSDVDLLGVVDEGRIHREVAARGASLYNYPVGTLIEKAKQGDLFLAHITHEGVVLHDTAGIFLSIKESFCFKSSYDDEISEASAIVWYLSERSNGLAVRRARKRMVWALRTILIASAAQSEKALFSSAALEEFSKIDGLKRLIDRRFTVEISNLRNVAMEIAEQFGKSRRELGLDDRKLISSADLTRFGALAASSPGLLKLRRVKSQYE